MVPTSLHQEPEPLRAMLVLQALEPSPPPWSAPSLPVPAHFPAAAASSANLYLNGLQMGVNFPYGLISTIRRIIQYIPYHIHCFQIPHLHDLASVQILHIVIIYRPNSTPLSISPVFRFSICFQPRPASNSTKPKPYSEAGAEALLICSLPFPRFVASPSSSSPSSS